MNWRFLTSLLIILTCVFLIIYDIVAISLGGVEATISRVVLAWARNYPIIPFALGVVVGHIFWPQKKDPKE